jgi:Ca-activated chloride channel family protein
MKLAADLICSSYAFDQDTDTHLVLTVTAPEKVGEQRTPLCVVPVIDVSGSMAGAKLEYAKLSCSKLIDHLRPGDYCGLITFEAKVETVIPVQRVTAENKAALKAAIAKLRPLGSTNFSGGLLEALRQVDAADLPLEVLCRVIMFTDGHPNAGIATKSEDILKLLSNVGRVTVSAFGYGDDACQEFLAVFSERGNGNYAYITEPDGALSAFGRELGGLLSTVASNLVLEVKANAAHQISSVVSLVPHENEVVGGETTIRINDLYAEEVRHIVLAVKLKELKQAFPRPVNAFEVKLAYDTLGGTGKLERKTLEAKAKVMFVKDATGAKIAPELQRVVSLALLSKAQEEAEKQAQQGNFEQARYVLHEVAEASPDMRSVVGLMSDSYENHGNYAASAGYRSSMRRGCVRGMGMSGTAAEVQKQLESVGVCLSNSTQNQTSALFVEPVLVEPALIGNPAENALPVIKLK